MDRNDDARTTGERHEPEPGEKVGLGRVVTTDRHDDPGGHPATDDVEEASDESFPASDPPAFAPGRPVRARDEVERPDPRDVP